MIVLEQIISVLGGFVIIDLPVCLFEMHHLSLDRVHQPLPQYLQNNRCINKLQNYNFQ